MSGAGRTGDLSYEARARLADNLFPLRKRAGYSQEALGRRAMVSPCGIGDIENGKVLGLLDTYVRLAGGLSLTLDELLTGVTWTAAVVELEYKTSYGVEFDGLADPE